MSALFPRWTNNLSKATVGIALATPAVAIGALFLLVRSPLATGQNNAPAQPVQFDHRHHVGDEGIDCRYCHTSVDKSPSAGIPPTATCMGCHGQIWNQTPRLEPVREAYFSGEALRWNRVHDLPDFVYFNHSIHVNKGIGCVSCHGRVDEMALAFQTSPLSMQWCLDCHRDPTPNLRPQEEITSMTWVKPAGDEGRALTESLAQQLKVHSRTSCTTCHR